MKIFEKDPPNSIWDWIQHKYWDIIPYDYRPSRIYYRLKCFLWHRYTTIKPRTLKYHTWCDRCVLIPHMMFEILSQYVEREADNIEWYGEYGHKIKVNDEEVFVRDEMQFLYDWWHKTYLGEYPNKNNEIWKNLDDVMPEYYFDANNMWNPQFSTEENATLYHNGMNQLHELESNTEKQLEEMMIRLVKITPCLWS